jgi:hypothetical protein
MKLHLLNRKSPYRNKFVGNKDQNINKTKEVVWTRQTASEAAVSSGSFCYSSYIKTLSSSCAPELGNKWTRRHGPATKLSRKNFPFSSLVPFLLFCLFSGLPVDPSTPFVFFQFDFKVKDKENQNIQPKT